MVFGYTGAAVENFIGCISWNSCLCQANILLINEKISFNSRILW